MKKQDFINALHAELSGEVSKVTIEDIIAAQARVAAKVIGSGNDFTVPGIVAMTIKAKAARIGRNPQTGGEVHIPAKRVVRAKPAHNLREV